MPTSALPLHTLFVTIKLRLIMAQGTNVATKINVAFLPAKAWICLLALGKSLRLHKRGEERKASV